MSLYPWIGSDCDIDIYTDLGEVEERAICIGRDGSQPSRATKTTSQTSTTTVTSATSVAPTQPGMVSGCTAYYTVVDGDTCYDVYTRHDITFQQFFDWNPAGKSLY